MNEMNDHLKAELEHITSRAPRRDGELSVALLGEAAALREAWRALGQSLEKADAAFDEAAFARRMARELECGKSTTQPVLPANRPRRARLLWLLGGTLTAGLLAASLLIALIVSYQRGNSDSEIVKGTKKFPSRQATVKQDFIAGSSGAEEYPPEGASSSTSEGDESPWNWDDALDSQITVAAAQMEIMQERTHKLDASISTLNWQLQQMAQDLEEGAL